jgi:hypothetical protein
LLFLLFSFDGDIGTAFAMAVPILVVGVGWSVIRLLIARRWKMAMLVVLYNLLSAPLTGAVQLETCPHATYLLIYGSCTTVVGTPCNNGRDFRPWWVRGMT